MTSCESRLGFTGWSKAFLKQPWTTAKIVSSRQTVLVSAFSQICSSKWMFCCVWVKWPSPNLPYIWTKTTTSNSVSFEQWVYLTWDKIAFQGTRRELFCHLVFFMFSSLEENMWLLAAVACRPLVFSPQFQFLVSANVNACMKTFLKLVSSEILPWRFKETYGVSFSAPLEASHLHFRWRYECAFIPTQNFCNFSSGNIFAVCLVAAVAQGIKCQEKISHTKEDTPAWHQFSLPVPRSHTPKQTAPRRKTCCRNSTRQMQEETAEGETLEKISIQNGIDQWFSKWGPPRGAGGGGWGIGESVESEEKNANKWNYRIELSFHFYFEM